MGTRSNIAVQLPNGKYKQLYCHWDGYLSHNGRILYEHYNSSEKVMKLFELGRDFPSLEETPEKIRLFPEQPGYPHELDNPSFDEEYLYVFKNNTWYVQNHLTDGLIMLESELVRENIIEDNSPETFAEEEIKMNDTYYAFKHPELGYVSFGSYSTISGISNNVIPRALYKSEKELKRRQKTTLHYKRHDYKGSEFEIVKVQLSYKVEEK